MSTLAPIHGGEILMKEFLEPLHLSQNRLAVTRGAPLRRINERSCTASAASPPAPRRLSRFLGTTDRFWLNLQTRYDFETEPDHLGLVRSLIA